MRLPNILRHLFMIINVHFIVIAQTQNINFEILTITQTKYDLIAIHVIKRSIDLLL